MIALKIRRFIAVFAALGSASCVVAGTHRFDHVEFESFPGGFVNVVGINSSGLVAGSSGGMTVADRHALISDSTGKLIPINTLGLSHSAATAISDTGYIVGTGCFMSGEDCTHVAFRYSAGEGMIDLGTPSSAKAVFVSGVNEIGDVTGFWAIGERTMNHGFLFATAGGIQDLGSLGNGFTQPSAINDTAVVVGQSRVGPFPQHHHAFAWQGGAMTDLGTFGGITSQAVYVNSAGDVVGWALEPNFNSRAFVIRASGEREMQMLPMPADATSNGALAINDAGMILISFMRENLNSGMALIMPDNSMIEIPLLETFPTGSAIAMNNLGHVVGANVKVIGSNEIVSAFYWSPETGTIQLDDAIISGLPWTIFNPVAINDADEILVRTFTNDGEKSAFVRPAIAGDVNGDRHVNIDDLLGVLNAWGACPDTLPGEGGCHADVNSAGTVDIDDILQVISNWG